MTLTPEDVKKDLTSEQYRLYRLIWGRFLACQMASAVYDSVSIEAQSAGYTFRASHSELKFSGFAGEMLDAFLAAYKKAGIAPIPLKAVRTEHNDKWSLYALCEELRREHAAMLLRGSFGK